jgi:LDH2 family malate/lactate/ureidoglycolate dehydrogenase
VSAPGALRIDAATLARQVSELFVAAGVPPVAARTVADALVDADREGVASHGVLLVPMYIERLRAGSVSPATEARLVHGHGAIAVLDAGHMLGQLSADQAMRLAVERAWAYGVGAIAVRHAFHFGVARRYALQAARAGCVGIAACNTRPLMPAPGGAERLVGNNPIAIAFPAAGEAPVVADLALSEVAMGRIRLAALEGRPIPPTWAADADGRPTTDPAAAIAGMLLPAAGAKGFGLAFLIDLLCGVLSAGAWGERVQPLYGDRAVPYDCSHFFLALDAAAFRPRAEIEREVEAAAARIRASRPAPGTTAVMAPGEPEWRRRQAGRSAGDFLDVPRAVFDELVATAASLGIPLSAPE